jgi:YesN/AraC family two-component response regulator
LLDTYYESDIPQKQGLPSVRYCAEKLNLSANYLGDLIKNETGKSALEHIQLHLIEIAKNKMFEKNKSVSQIAYELGFEYPQYFSRLFKKCVGISPNEYRAVN